MQEVKRLHKYPVAHLWIRLYLGTHLWYWIRFM